MDVFIMSRPCLKGTIQNAETAVVKCPYTDQDYSCDMQLLDREIKSVNYITEQKLTNMGTRGVL